MVEHCRLCSWPLHTAYRRLRAVHSVWKTHVSCIPLDTRFDSNSQTSIHRLLRSLCKVQESLGFQSLDSFKGYGFIEDNVFPWGRVRLHDLRYVDLFGATIDIGSGAPQRGSWSHRVGAWTIHGFVNLLALRKVRWLGVCVAATEPEVRHPPHVLGRRHHNPRCLEAAPTLTKMSPSGTVVPRRSSSSKKTLSCSVRAATIGGSRCSARGLPGPMLSAASSIASPWR